MIKVRFDLNIFIFTILKVRLGELKEGLKKINNYKEVVFDHIKRVIIERLIGSRKQ